MNHKQNILIIIPARGGSKGIPRKNLRILNGYPLIYYVIKTSLLSKFKPDVYVSSDDDEILTIAKKFGAKTHKRKKALADGKTTLDPVVINAFHEISEKNRVKYNIVITIQPTSPLLSAKTLDDAITYFLNHPDIETLLSATEDTHLTWGMKEGKFFPNYVKRVNRQELPPIYRETGAFFISRPELFKQNTRIGKKVDLFIVPDQEKIDVDTFEDWSICEFHLKRKKILFVITGYDKVGLGHVYNALAIADEILDHQVSFLVDDKSDLACDKIKKAHHSVYKQMESDIVKDIEKLKPDIVINDRLDTTQSYVQSLKKISKLVINFEDLGEGSHKADLVINAMYPEGKRIKNHFYGKDYLILRNEFQYSEPAKSVNTEVKNVVITFGGTDPNNFTLRVVDEIYHYCIENGIVIHVVLGMGYTKLDSIKRFDKISILKNIGHLSEVISNGDICFTSAGRTTFEIASIGIPTIVLCQNRRESTHFFASEENGFINLGENDKIPHGKVLETFIELSNNLEKRASMHRLMIAQNLREGKKNVLELIRKNFK
jgi:CMP-N-acetylneuraminic acid synthetase/spore coat polysaccharide biosynthesis predicted glycosyltransferase SpsG